VVAQHIKKNGLFIAIFSVCVFQGSIQRCAAMYQQGNRTTVCCKDCRCSKIHFKSWIKHRR